MSHDIGKKIRFIRKQKKLSSKEVSAQLGLKGPASLHSIENGTSSPSIERLENISHILGISVVELYQFEIPETYHSHDDHYQSEFSILGKKIHKLVSDSGHKTDDICERIHLNAKAFTLLSRGRLKNPPLKVLLNFSKEFNVSLNYLIDDSIEIGHYA